MNIKTKASARGARNQVRIVGGSWRGRRVSFPDSPGLRPTPDRVRETLFNWLQMSIAGTRCLDLFAGSGVLGLEALSRGAREVVFVEEAGVVARSIETELERLGGAARGHVLELPAARFLAHAGGSGAMVHAAGPFDIAFLDPPFGLDSLTEYVRELAAGEWMKNGGLVYLEAERTAQLPPLPAGWELLKSKSAGEVGYYLVRVTARLPLGLKVQ